MTKTFLSHRNWVERDYRWTNCDTIRIWYVNLEEKTNDRTKSESFGRIGNERKNCLKVYPFDLQKPYSSVGISFNEKKLRF